VINKNPFLILTSLVFGIEVIDLSKIVEKMSWMVPFGNPSLRLLCFRDFRGLVLF